MKIIAVGMNYALHNQELGHTSVNKEPVIFMKPDSAILKDGKPFFIPDFSNEVHYETELVVRINRLGKNISPRFASRYYDALTVGIDFTARDLQRKFREAGNPWELCKGFDSSAAIGTFVPVDRYKDIQSLNFNLMIDGKEVQRGCTADMLFKVDDIIAYVSKFVTLKIGDLLFTGTPAGVGPVSIGQHLQRKFREAGNPWELCKGFDSSAAIGTFVPVDRYKDIQSLNFNLMIDGKEVQRGCTADMLFKVDDIIAYVSKFVTLKIGDLLFTGTPAGVGPVSIGQHLQGYLEGEKLLDFYIR